MTPGTMGEAMSELMRLVEREHQRINDMEQQVQQLRQQVRHLKEELAEERSSRQMLGTRVERVETTKS